MEAPTGEAGAQGWFAGGPMPTKTSEVPEMITTETSVLTAGELLDGWGENPVEDAEGEVPLFASTADVRADAVPTAPKDGKEATGLCTESRLELRQLRVALDGFETWYAMVDAPVLVKICDDDDEAGRFMESDEGKRLLVDDPDASFQKQNKLSSEQQKQLLAKRAPIPEQELFVSQYLVFACGGRLGYVQNLAGDTKSDVGLKINYRLKGAAHIALEFSRIKKGMYMWLTNNGYTPDTDSRTCCLDFGEICGNNKHAHHEGNEVNRRIPLPAERAAPWMEVLGDGDQRHAVDTGYYHYPVIYSASVKTDSTDLEPVLVQGYSTWHTPLADLGVLGGAGMRIYFTILMTLAIVFFVLGVFSVPGMLINRDGHNYGDKDSVYRQDTYPFSGKVLTLTMGNLNYTRADLDNGEVGRLYITVFLDAFTTLLLGFFIVYFGKKVENVTEEADSNMQSMADYTVFIRPHRSILNRRGMKVWTKNDRDEFVGQLKIYLEDNVSAQLGDDTTSQKVQVAEFEHYNPRTQKKELGPAIWPVYDEEENIVLWRRKLNECHDLEEAIAHVIDERENVENAANGGTEESNIKAQDAMHSRLRALEKTQQKLDITSKKTYRTVGAFVTFEHESDFDTAVLWGQNFKGEPVKANSTVQHYPKFAPPSAKADPQEEGLRVARLAKNPFGVQLEADEAPEPEVIMWDHLEYDKYSLTCRWFCINTFAFCMLIVGAVAIVFCAVAKESLDWTNRCSQPGIGLANTEVFQLDMINTSRAYTGGVEVMKPFGEHPYCDGLTGPRASAAAYTHYKGAWTDLSHAYTTQRWTWTFPQLFFSGGNHKCRLDNKTHADRRRMSTDHDEDSGCCGEEEDDMRMTWSDAEKKGCQRQDNWEYDEWASWEEVKMVKGVSHAITKHFSRDTACYACACVVQDPRVSTDEPLDANYEAIMKLMPGGREKYCDTFDLKKATAVKYGYISTFVVVIVNQVVKQFLQRIVNLEKNHTVGAEQSSVALKVYLAQLFNTALLMIILRLKMWSFNVNDYNPWGLNGEWYHQVALPLVFTMVTQFLVPPVTHLFMNKVFKIKRHCKRRGAFTQNALIRMYDSGQLQLAASYGEVLLGMSVCLVYSSALPMLNFIAAIGFTLKFWVDKWAVLNVYMKPPLYGHELFNGFEEIWFCMLTGHALFGVFFYATVGGTAPDISGFFNKNSYFRPHVIPMIVVLVICILIISAINCRRIYSSCTLAGRRKVQEARVKLIQDRLTQAHEDGKKQPIVFSEALKQDKIVNESDDYHMDEHEDMLACQQSFMDRIKEDYTKGLYPFDDEKLAKKMFNAVKSPLLHAEQELTRTQEQQAAIDNNALSRNASGYTDASPIAFQP